MRDKTRPPFRLYGRWSDERGFTLLEMITAFTLLAIMATFVFSVVVDSSRRSKFLEREINLRMEANAIVNLICEDLKGAYIMEGVVPFFNGVDDFYRDNPSDGVSLLTTSGVPINPSAVTSDLSEVEYKLSYDEEERSFFARREQSPPEPPFDEGGVLNEVSWSVRAFNLRYSDGEDWVEDWDSQDMGREQMKGKLPHEVEIEITLMDGDLSVTCRTRIAPCMAASREE